MPYKNPRLQNAKNKISVRLLNKAGLQNLIIKQGYSLAAAAAKFDMDECRVESILYTNRPSENQIKRAFEIYDKGFSLLIACAASGVSPAAFKKARKAQAVIDYRPARW